MKKQFIKPEIKLTGMEAQQIICTSGLTGSNGTNTIIQSGGSTSSLGSNLQVD